MRYGVDMAFPPTQQVAGQIAARGWSFCSVYVGGPRALSGDAWHIRDGARYPVGDINGIFEEFVPIYVGRNVGDNPLNPWDRPTAFSLDSGMSDGEDANMKTGACGFDSDSPLFLDCEYGTWQAHPGRTLQYFEGWIEVVRGAGHRVGLYTDPGTIRGLGVDNPFDITWCAQWMRSARGMQNAPVGRYDPRVPPPWDMWQFGTSIIAGTSVDLNSSADEVLLAKYAL